MAEAFAPAGEPVVLSAANGALVVRATAGRWTGIAPALTPVSISFQNGLELAGYGTTQMQPAGPVEVVLYWRPAQPLRDDAHVFVQILDRSGTAVAAAHVWPFNGVYRLGAWQPGQLLPMTFRFNLPQELAPGPYRLIAGLVDLTSQGQVPTAAGDSFATVAVLKIPRPPSTFVPAHSTAAAFGESIRLSGYTVEQAAGGTRITFQWQALSQMAADYTLFIHVVDPAGAIVAQADSQPFDGAYPTSLWSPGETLAEARTLTIPPGRYRIDVGFYLLNTGERLPVTVKGERQPEDQLALTDLQVP